MHTEPFDVDGETFTAQEIVDLLGPIVSDRRRERIDSVIANRTYNIAPVLEGLYDHGNVNAVIRSAEALGYQNAHVIESSKRFKVANRVAQGATKWLDVHIWETTSDCLAHIKNCGYRLAVTHLERGRPIADLSFDVPTAILFGNERDGVTQEALDAADECVIVPMPGFTRSFNISVAAALSLYHIYRDRTERLGSHGDLNEHERLCLRAEYYRRSVEHADRMLLEARERS